MSTQNSFQQSLGSYGTLISAGNFTYSGEPTTQWDVFVSIPSTAKNITIIYTNISPSPDLYDIEFSSDNETFTPLITINPQGDPGSTKTVSFLISYETWYTEMQSGLARTSVVTCKPPSCIRVIQRGEYNPTLISMTMSVFYQ